MTKAFNFYSVVFAILFIIGLALIILSVWLDTYVVSKIDWLWIAIAGFIIMGGSILSMKNK